MLSTISEITEGNKISCEVIRGSVVDGKRTSMALITVCSETKPPTDTFIPPLFDMKGIHTIHLLVDYSNVGKIRSVLEDPTTPTPEVTGYQINLMWNGDTYAKTNPDNLVSNHTGKVVPVHDQFQLTSMIPPDDKEGEITIAFINQYPKGYNVHDRIEVRTKIMNDEFNKLQLIHSKKHVYLYIESYFLTIYESLIPGFTTYWKKVVTMESFYYFTNDFFGKNVIGAVTPSLYTISVNSSFNERFLLHEPLYPLSAFDQIKTRGWTESSFTTIDIGTKLTTAGSKIAVFVNDPVEDPFTTVTMRGMNSIREMFCISSTVTDSTMDQSHVVIESIMYHEQTKQLVTHTEKRKWMRDHLPFTSTFELESPLSVFFTFSHPSLSVMHVIKYVCDTVHIGLHKFIRTFYEIDYELHRDVRNKHIQEHMIRPFLSYNDGLYEPSPELLPLDVSYSTPMYMNPSTKH